jgi:hypothetical protein
MWALSYGPPSFGRDCRLGLALRRQESLGFECSHAALPSSGDLVGSVVIHHDNVVAAKRRNQALLSGIRSLTMWLTAGFCRSASLLPQPIVW